MKCKQIVIIALLCAALAGCSPFVPIQTLDNTGADVFLAASKMPVVSADTARGMQELGPVVGYSCKLGLGNPGASRADATDQAKVAAAQRRATAVTSLTCKESGVSLFTNCWESWECKATALR